MTAKQVAVALPGAGSVEGAPMFEIANLQLGASGEIGMMQLNLLGSEFLAILRYKYQHEAGFILAGTSAGASALAEVMLVDGHGWRSLLGGRIEVKPGLGLLPGVLLDQHFAERGRYPRLMHAVLAQPALLGIGLSEETGLVISPGQPVQVFGEEAVVVVDAAEVSHNNLPGLAEGAVISGHGLRLHLLVAGQQLDLATREVVG